MSKHFIGRKEAEQTTGLAYLLSPKRPQSPGEQRFRRHAHARGCMLIGMVLYFIYSNPEYSYTYTALRQYCGWDTAEPMFPQYLKLRPSLPSKTPTSDGQTREPSSRDRGSSS